MKKVLGDKIAFQEHFKCSSKYILKDGTKLSEVFENLPHGIINKTETGIGATTLELNAKRNSIIVEPIKITASSKVHEHNLKGAQSFYVGSRTRYHDRAQNDEILAYLKDKNVKHKKIVVVADSLVRVLNLINSIDKKLFEKFFLMIDEADAFQYDSTYRKNMEHCFAAYKKFPSNKRALVTATMLKFSDPALESEYISTIEYENPTSRAINLLYSNNIKGAAFDYIVQCLTNFPEDKIMVAYNAVSYSYDIAEELNNQGYLSADDIKIMCGTSSKGNVKNYFHELDTDKLPARLTFVTSAYFSGFDLKEDYHLICLSNGVKKIQSLSEHKLKQIAGRCRNPFKLLSETVIYTSSKAETKTPHTKEELIDIANFEINGIKCLEHNFSGHPLLKETLDKVKNLIANNVELKGYKYVWIDDEKIPQISYLNIDAYLEMIRVRDMIYKERDLLPDILVQQGCYLTKLLDNSQTVIPDLDIANETKNDLLEITIEKLRLVNSLEEVELLMREKGLVQRQLEVINIYYDLMGYVDNAYLLDNLLKKSKGRDNRALMNFYFQALYQTLSPINLYKRNVEANFKIGKIYSAQELLQNWNKVLVESGIKRVLKPGITSTRMLRIHFKFHKPVAGSYKITDIVKLPNITYRPEELSINKLLSRAITSIVT